MTLETFSPPGLASLAATHWFMGWADKLISLWNLLILILELAVINLLRYLCPLGFFRGFSSLVDKVNWPLPPHWHHKPGELWRAFQDCNLKRYSAAPSSKSFSYILMTITRVPLLKTRVSSRLPSVAGAERGRLVCREREPRDSM